MTDHRPPVPAVPSVVLALGHSLRHKLTWLERRFRSEIGSLYPGSLLRFRLAVRREDLSPEALHALCDPLLGHPLWLGLHERGLAPGRDLGPQLNVYALLSQDDRGIRLLPLLYTNLHQLYDGHPEPSLRVFYVGAPDGLPSLPDATGPVPCFILGPVKQYGYRSAGRQEPFETVRLALNALLASPAGHDLEELLQAGQATGPVAFALGASAIAVARPQMETWLRNTLLARLAEGCLAGESTYEAGRARHLAARQELEHVFDLKPTGQGDEPDEVWERRAGRRIAGLFPAWANSLLADWGLELHETRRGHWRPAAHTQGDLYRRLQQLLSEASELQEDAQAALSQDIVRLAGGLRREFERREQAILTRWSDLLGRSVGGPGCLAGVAEVVSQASAALARARDVTLQQRLSPLWLRGDADVVALAGILAAQMMPVRSAAERARRSFVPPAQVGLRLLPFIMLAGLAGADLRPHGWGLSVGLAVGLGLGVLATVLQDRKLSRETYGGVRELCRLYENAIGGLMLAEARNTLRHLQEAVAVSVGQLRAVSAELERLRAEASATLDELSRFPRENTYLERQLSDTARCAKIAEQVGVEGLLEVPLGAAPMPGGTAVTPGTILAATLRGDLPAAALGAGLVEAVGRVVAQRGSGAIETRVEEMLVAGNGRPFDARDTMDGLQRRALPLCPQPEGSGPEVGLIVLSREAAMAFQPWLSAHAGEVRVLPTLQRDRISYLRLRRLSPPAAAEGACTG